MTRPEQLKEASLFASLTDEQRKRVCDAGESRTTGQGELVFAEGDDGDEVLVLLEGRVQITKKMSRESEQAPVHTVVPGDVFGEFALVARLERSATARVSQDATFFALSRRAFRELADTDPGLGYVVLRDLGEVLVDRIRKTTEELRSSLMF